MRGHGKHTRQGTARGQRHGTLDRSSDDEPDDAFWSASNHTKANQKDAMRKPSTDTLDRALNPDYPYGMGGLGGCWCGEKSGHDWPGRDEGAPHPR